MEMQPLDRMEDHTSGETPEDVAILYSWANLEGAKYRDFSANRREYRAQMRHRAAEQLRLMELRAQSEAEAAAAEAEAEAAAANAEADAASVKLAANRTMQASSLMKAAAGPEELEAEEQVEYMRRSSLREAAQQARRAAAERLEAARRAEAAALADSIARREEREIAEAQASALRQAAQYAEAETRNRQKRAAQPDNPVPGRISDPYGPQVVAEGEYFERPGTPVSELEAIRFRQQREYIEQNTGADLPQFRAETLPTSPPRANNLRQPMQKPLQGARGYQPDEPLVRRAAATDESLIGASAQDFGEDRDFEPRRTPRPVYDERYLAMARDAHRLDEAGALELRREQNREAEWHNGNPGPLRRVAVPSIPYKEFRRAPNYEDFTSIPEVVSRIPEPPLEQYGWNRADVPTGPGHPQSRGNEPGDRRPNRRADAGERWVPTDLPGGEAGFDGSSPRNGNAGSARQGFEVSPGPELPRTVQSPEFQPWESGDGRRNGFASAPGSHAPRDPFGVAWEQPDPRMADKQPTWPSRPEGEKPESPVAADARPKVPVVDSPGPNWLYPKTQGPRFVDSLLHSGSRARVQLAVESLKVGSGQRASEAAREDGVEPPARGGQVENAVPRREQPASRWFVLKNVFARADRVQKHEPQALREKKRSTPFLVVYSLTGGVGKTSLVATLGRALSSLGEKVLLADTTSQGLLPFYFGASELHPGVVRTFSPPSGSTDAPIHLVSYDFAGQDPAGGGRDGQSDVFEELVANSQSANRVLMDLNVNSGWMLPRIAWTKPTILVPLAPDMNSVIGLQTIERSFHGLKDAEGNALQPVYLLNQFDDSRPLHVDVREVLKQQLGDRLLPFEVRRTSGVGEALAEGMTIVDYDPESEAAKDYMGVANWLRNASAPATVGLRNLRWSER